MNNEERAFMKNNFVSLWICVLMEGFLLFMYLLLRNEMSFPLKVGYGALQLALIILISFNIVTIIKKNQRR
jgi:hypothetical protein